jgi:hypothetical protein
MRKLVALLLFRSRSTSSKKILDVPLAIAWAGFAVIAILILIRLYLTS